MRQDRFLIWRNVAGETKSLHGFEVTPEAQAVGLRLPFAGFIWTRPVAVSVRNKGASERIPIVDVTRVAQVAIVAAALLVGLTLWQMTMRDQQSRTRRA